MDNLFEAFQEWYSTYGYWILFLGVFLENVGIPVPGETAVLVAGFLCSPPGGEHLQLHWVILITVIAAVLGDNLGFWLGRELARPRLQAGKAFLVLTPKAAQLAEDYFHRYGTWTVFFARFITGLRVFCALAAGTAGMPWKRFVLANIGGAVVWAVVMSLLGYCFGHSWHLLHAWIGRGGLIALGSVLVLGGLIYVLHRRRGLSQVLLERLARAQVWLGVVAAVLEVVCLALLVLIITSPEPAVSEPDTDVDQEVQQWVTPVREHSAWLDPVAMAGQYASTLPVQCALVLLLAAYLWYSGRGWRDIAALVGALLASEGFGLVLLALLRQRGVEPARTAVWPFGFAGLEPMRAMAVFGMAAYLLGRRDRRTRWLSGTAAGALILLTSLGVVWLRDQRLTAVLLENTAGGLILFAGIWWLEGFATRPAALHEPTGIPASPP